MCERRWEWHWEMPRPAHFLPGRGKARLPFSQRSYGTCPLWVRHQFIDGAAQRECACAAGPPIAIIVTIGVVSCSSLRCPFWLKCCTDSRPTPLKLCASDLLPFSLSRWLLRLPWTRRARHMLRIGRFDGCGEWGTRGRGEVPCGTVLRAS